LLTRALISKIARKMHRPALRIADKAIDVLQHHNWPGNVRELENTLTQALVHAQGNLITSDLLILDDRPLPASAPPPANQGPGHIQATKTLDQVTAEHIQLVLNHTGGHKGKSCGVLGISRPALDRKIKKYRLSLPHG